MHIYANRTVTGEISNHFASNMLQLYTTNNCIYKFFKSNPSLRTKPLKECYFFLLKEEEKKKIAVGLSFNLALILNLQTISAMEELG